MGRRPDRPAARRARSPDRGVARAHAPLAGGNFRFDREWTNRHLHPLSILTTLLLPPTLVTGVFGMNIKGLPFVDSEHAILWVSGLMIGSAAAVFLLISRVGVFKL
jgi:hypothetical protein